MSHQNLEFHNVVELEKIEGLSGLRLRRSPVAACVNMSERGRWNSQMSHAVEIRCVTAAENLRLLLSTMEGDGPVMIFQGDFHHSSHHVRPGGPHSIHVSPAEQLKVVKPELLRGRRFAPNVWRFLLTGFFPVFHQMETYGHEVRPPNAAEKPRVRWLAYGSSITGGSGSTGTHLGYVQQTAHRLGVDALNMGQGGACMCEPELADFFAARGDWDFATLEIGVNMLDRFTAAEFEARAAYMVDAMRTKNPGKPVVLITPFSNSHHFLVEETTSSEQQRKFTAVLERLAVSRGCPLLDGRALLTDFSGLTADLIHPFDTGMAQMAENLAAGLRDIPAIRGLLTPPA